MFGVIVWLGDVTNPCVTIEPVDGLELSGGFADQQSENGILVLSIGYFLLEINT